MAIPAADRAILIRAVLTAYHEDYQAIAKLYRTLRAAFPAVNWASEFNTAVTGWAPFTESGVSKAWFVAEIARLAN